RARLGRLRRARGRADRGYARHDERVSGARATLCRTRSARRCGSRRRLQRRHVAEARERCTRGLLRGIERGRPAEQPAVGEVLERERSADRDIDTDAPALVTRLTGIDSSSVRDYLLATASASSASRRDETPSFRNRLLTCERTVCSEIN